MSVQKLCARARFKRKARNSLNGKGRKTSGTVVEKLEMSWAAILRILGLNVNCLFIVSNKAPANSFSFSLKVSIASPLIMWKMAAELCRKPAKPWPSNSGRSNAQVAAWLHKTCILLSCFKIFQSWSLFQDTSRRPNCHDFPTAA